MYFNQKYKLAIWAVSLSVVVILYTLLYLQGIYVPSAPYFIPVTQRINNALACGIFIALFFPAIIEYNNTRWFQGVDFNTPRLLKDITETVKSGAPLYRALEEATDRDYGPISKALENAMVKLRLSSDLKGALDWLGETLIRPSIKRMSIILLEANEAGGDIIDLLNNSVHIFTNLAEYREERYQNSRPYIFLVYLGSIIFLIMSWLILTQLLAPILATTSNPSVGQVGFIATFLDIGYYKSILFWAAIIEAVFGGLVAGKICEGRTSAGLIHSIILLAITIIFFNSFNI